MRLLKQSTARDIVVFLVDSTDHVTGKTGATLTITASKNGDAFASISPTVTERVNGWYEVALTSSHTDTLGDLALHITATGADPIDTVMQVIGVDLNDTVRAGLTALPNANAEASGGLYTRGTGAGQIEQVVNGTVRVDLGHVVSEPLASWKQYLGLFGNAIYTGTVQGATSTSLTLGSGLAASPINGSLIGWTVVIYPKDSSPETGVAQARKITAYDSATRIATVSPAWITDPHYGDENATEYKVIPEVPSSVDEVQSGAIASTAFDTATLNALRGNKFYGTAAGGGQNSIVLDNSLAGSPAAITDQIVGMTVALTGNERYPLSEEAIEAAVGFGDWTGGSGWLFNNSSSDVPAQFGSFDLAAFGTPVYSQPGPRPGDLAIKFDAGGSDSFSAGDNFDVGASDDLILAGVAKFEADLANGDVAYTAIKRDGTTGYHVVFTRSSLSNARAEFFVGDGVDEGYATVQFPDGVMPVGEWFAWMAVVDRTHNVTGCAVRTLAGVTTISSLTSISAVGSLSNTAGFEVSNSGVGKSWFCDALYAVTGSGKATGLAANLETAIKNFADNINGMDTQSRKVIAYVPETRTAVIDRPWTCPPNSLTDYEIFGVADTAGDSTLYGYAAGGSSTTLVLADTDRGAPAGPDDSLIGMTVTLRGSLDYPQTAAQMKAAAARYGRWTSGYLCNEKSGSLAPIFGSVSLSANGTPTYYEDGARGGDDRSVEFDAAGDYFDAASTVNDVTATEDLGVAWVWKLTTLTGGQEARLLVKSDFAGGPYYILYATATGMSCAVGDGVDDEGADPGGALFEEWVAGIFVLDRSTNKIRVGIKGLETGTIYISSEVDVSSVGSLSNAEGFVVGSQAGQPWWLSGLFIAKGVGACTGMSANLATILDSFSTVVKNSDHVQSRTITDFAFSTRTATIDRAWAGFITPSGLSRYEITPAPTTLRATTYGNTLDVDSSGNVDANVEEWRGTAVADPAVEGVPSVEVTSITSTAANTIINTLMAFSHDTGLTIKGFFRRLDAMAAGKATGLKSAIARFFMRDGTTSAIQANQDVAAGTRSAADVSGSES